MDDGNDGVPDEALEEVAYLARSSNRVELLATLSGEALTRGELATRTDVSRSTLDRIVNEFEARGWVERTADGAYTATPTGTHLIEHFEPFVESVAAIRTLGDAVSWLPTDTLPIELRYFSDATVKQPTVDPTETVDYFAGMIDHAEAYQSLTHFAPPAPVSEAILNRIETGELMVRAVATAAPIEYIADRPDRSERWQSILRHGAELYRYEEPIPCNLWVIDDVVLIKDAGDEPVPESYGAPIVVSNDAVRSWAVDLLDQYAADARPVTPTDFTPGTAPSPADHEDRRDG